MTREQQAEINALTAKVAELREAARAVLEAYIMGGDDEQLGGALNWLESVCGFDQQRAS